MEDRLVIVTIESVEEEMREATMRELRHLIEEEEKNAENDDGSVDKRPLSVYN